MTIDNIKEEIQKAEDIVILTHESPDGDAVGSALAMYLTLKKLGKTVDVIIPEYASMFDFLPGANQIKKEGKQEAYDLVISVDVTGINRLNGFAKYFENAKEKFLYSGEGEYIIKINTSEVETTVEDKKYTRCLI